MRSRSATGLLVAGGIRDDGFTAGEIGEREADFEKASDTARRWQSRRPATLICFQDTAFGVGQLGVIVMDDAVNLPEIQMIGLKTPQRFF